MRRTVLTILCVVAAAGAGCGDKPSAPGGPPPERSLFYPLDTGNRWAYTSSFSIGFYDPDTGEEIRADTTLGVWDVELTGSETIGGVNYVLETTITTAGAVTDTTWVRLRQDTTGLYRADIPRRIPPGSDELAVYVDPPPEIRRLGYPLETGASWELFPAATPVTATVEAAETLVTPAGSLGGWRIRIDNPGAGPEDQHRVWYGRDGKLREIQHMEAVAIDDFTGERIRIVSESTMFIRGIVFAGNSH